MATTLTNGVTTTTSTNVESYTSAAFTPAAGDYLFVFVVATDTLVNGSMSDTQSLGWTLVGSVTSHTTNKVIVYKSNATTAATSMTVTWDCTGDAATGAGLMILRVAGSDGGVRQFATNTDVAAVVPNVVFSSNCLTTSAVLFCTANKSNPHGTTPPTGYIGKLGGQYNTPTTGMALAVKVSGETTDTVTAGAACATDWTTVGVEIFGLGTTGRSVSGVVVTPAISSLNLLRGISITSNATSVSRGSLLSSLNINTSSSNALGVVLDSLSASVESSDISIPISGHIATYAIGTLVASQSNRLAGLSTQNSLGVLNNSLQKSIASISTSALSSNLQLNRNISILGKSIPISNNNIITSRNFNISSSNLLLDANALGKTSSAFFIGIEVPTTVAQLTLTTNTTISGVSNTVTGYSLVPLNSIAISGHEAITTIDELLGTYNISLTSHGLVSSIGNIEFILDINEVSVTLLGQFNTLDINNVNTNSSVGISYNSTIVNIDSLNKHIQSNITGYENIIQYSSIPIFNTISVTGKSVGITNNIVNIDYNFSLQGIPNTTSISSILSNTILSMIGKSSIISAESIIGSLGVGIDGYTVQSDFSSLNKLYSISISGENLTSSTGNLVLDNDAISVLFGNTNTVNQGNLTPSISYFISITGVATSTNITNINIALDKPISGVPSNVSTNTISNSITNNLLGMELSTNITSLTSSNFRQISSNSISIGLSSVVTSLLRTLSGTSSIISRGILTSSFNKAIVGLSNSVFNNVLTVSQFYTVVLSGIGLVNSQGNVGKLTLRSLFGNSLTSNIGDVGFPLIPIGTIEAEYLQYSIEAAYMTNTLVAEYRTFTINTEYI